MKKVLLLANFMDIDENTNNRFNYLAELLKNKCDLKIITSTFSHRDKKQREYKCYKNIHMLYEPGYKKNISIKRIYSHHILAKNLKKYLNNLKEKPDIIYCAVPSLSFAKEAAKYSKKYKIRFIIDIQDLWPEAFKMVFNIPILSNILFFPMKKSANYIYKSADDIVAVSDTYAERAVHVNKKYKNKLSVFLGTDLKYFDDCKEKNKTSFNDDIIRVVYIGTLGHSYDLKCSIDALEHLKNNGIKKIKLVVIGDGPLKEEFENYANKKEIDFEFIGRLKYDKMVGKLCACDIAINPISKGAAQSIINKVGDYAAAGLPVVSTQECEEYRKLVNNYKIGFNCDNNNSINLAEKIKELYLNKELRIELGYNNRKLAEKKFDRNVTYNQIIDLILK